MTLFPRLGAAEIVQEPVNLYGFEDAYEWTDDYVSKFISIVRARDYFLPVTIAILVFHQ